MPSLADDPLAELLARVAARTPAPASGTAAAVTCATAAALAEMVARFERGAPVAAGEAGPATGEAAERAAVLRARALELAQRDLASYRPVLEALRLPPSDERRGAAVAAALSRAAEVPFEIVVVAAEVAALAEELAGRAGRHALGDACTAATLAEAACRSAALLVAVNLRGSGDERMQQAEGLAREAGASRERALALALS
ncbi:MAG: cyclodeaminase/cyclohydrolase family protein [Solirubrobacteraceae bacterium]